MATTDRNQSVRTSRKSVQDEVVVGAECVEAGPQGVGMRSLRKREPVQAEP